MTILRYLNILILKNSVKKKEKLLFNTLKTEEILIII
jgi:hypothetical protein